APAPGRPGRDGPAARGLQGAAPVRRRGSGVRPPDRLRGVTVSVHDTDGRLVATAPTDANGQFEARLRPGRYRVSAGGTFTGGTPGDVEPPPGGVPRADSAPPAPPPSPARGGAPPPPPHPPGAGQEGERPPRP